MPAGQPTKFNKEVQRQALLLAAKGMTDKEMSEILGVKEQTFNNWKKAHPIFFESLKETKLRADKEVERSLYERACGYEHPDTYITVIDKKIVTKEIVKYYPPDPTSMIFWLKNRQRKKWRDKQELDVNIGLQSLSDKEIDKEMRELATNQGAERKKAVIVKGTDKA